MTRYAVVLAPEAIDDILAIHHYLSGGRSEAFAEEMTDRLLALCRTLETFPNRGHIPPELRAVGVSDFQEVHSVPYRVVYEVVGLDVRVHAILDGRRDLQDLLAERLLLCKPVR